jgi:predicted nucleotidyltransferase
MGKTFCEYWESNSRRPAFGVCSPIEADEMIDVISSNLQPIANLCQTYGVARLEVFGSAATGAFDPDHSDIDLIVTFADESPGLARRFVGFAESLEALLGRRVDLLIDKPFKNPYFRSSVNRSRTTIYARTDGEAAA